MSEVREVLRLTILGRGLREVARLSGLDRKTVRRYLAAARAAGFDPAAGEAGLTDAPIGAVFEVVRPARPGGHGQAWAGLAGRRTQIEAMLEEGLRLTKVETLLARDGLVVPYRTLHRFCTAELGFGRRARAAGSPTASRARSSRSTSAGSACCPTRWPAGGGSCTASVHRRVQPAHLRLADVPPDARRGHRRVRGGVGLPWRHLPGGCLRQLRGDRVGRRPARRRA